jgi:hypothetical protein
MPTSRCRAPKGPPSKLDKFVGFIEDDLPRLELAFYRLAFFGVSISHLISVLLKR